jgi:hypothetical protein
MAVTDMFVGDSSSKDIYATYDMARGQLADPARFLSLILECRLRKYKTLHFGSSAYSPIRETITPSWAMVSNPDLAYLCESALAQMKNAKENGAPFLAYFWDFSSHLACPNLRKDSANGVGERLRMAYSLVDSSLNRLLSGLARIGLWDETIIVGFGDHGDEPWSHGLNRGYCHGTAPYASMVWTPMFLFDPENFQPAITDRLSSMVDVKPTVMGLLFPEQPSRMPRTRHSGFDLMREKRELAFSQNMFALQREQSDPEQGMLKGYAVTDGKYRLVVVSGGRKPKNGGMGLYCDQEDPANSLNLLKFFKLDREGEIRRFAPPPEAVAKHFACVFGPAQVESLRNAFLRLKPALREFIRDKEAGATAEYRRIMDSAPDALAKEAAAAWKKNAGVNPNLRNQAAKFAKMKEAFSRNPPQCFPEMPFCFARSDRADSPNA